ncbi:thermonuclease family protein [Candidatus Pelagibacter communis]|uniref:thermonuclease family protein n=1 Tax=Pelagibacter ubique TaxID=198252 RepID=UPI0009E5532F|nr:thermonuclease family protein [Candidatus Pelagibacter ubique]
MKSYLKPIKNKIIYLILLIIFFSKTNSYSEEISGYAKVIDGDTIRIKGTKIRLYGIDAPENNQLCSKPWLSLSVVTFFKDYECGLKATNLLDNFIKNEIIVCKKKSLDRYNRVVAICFKKKRDINSWLVRNGLAVAYRKYSKKYIISENDAKKEKKGLWAGKFVMPWEWRKKHK